MSEFKPQDVDITAWALATHRGAAGERVQAASARQHSMGIRYTGVLRLEAVCGSDSGSDAVGERVQSAGSRQRSMGVRYPGALSPEAVCAWHGQRSDG
jgi:hypothetical protein